VSGGPAEAYAAFRARQAAAPINRFEADLGFVLDEYQREACAGLLAGESVLVAAPTGAGKTAVALFGIDLARQAGRRAFFTTPIKALSNQKFRELGERYGFPSVGLLTGDQSIRPDAPIVVMTTEVLRNMLYQDVAPLRDLWLVVLDEVHYLADRFRGPVWEEVLIQLPASVQVAALSATVSNAEEFGEWLALVRGAVRVVVSDVRPVPLWQHMLTQEGLKDLYAPLASGEQSTRLNPELALDVARSGRPSRPRGGRGRPRWDDGARPRTASRQAVVRALEAESLLPALYFVFSRAGCEAAAAECLRSGLVLTTPPEAAEIAELVERRAAQVASGDLGVIGYQSFLDGARAGFAPHHAGMLPLFKEAVEELFQAGLLKVVFATETLALGINMPARTVVMDRLDKWDGAEHSDITPGEYTQLTGRAGRRGIDVEGHAVVVAGPRVAPAKVLPLASKRTYPLRSAFRPTYNMTVNLTDRLGAERARAVLDLSFAQFQADRSVAGLAGQIRELDRVIVSHAAAMVCERGDIESYQAIRDRLTELEKSARQSRAQARRDETRSIVSQLRRGDILRAPSGPRRGLMLVLHAGKTGAGRPIVLAESGKARRQVIADAGPGISLAAHIKLASGEPTKTPEQRAALVARMRAAAAPDGAVSPPPSPETSGSASGATPDADRSRTSTASGGPMGVAPQAAGREAAALRAQLRSHPVHSCPDREAHARQARRIAKARAQRDSLERIMRRRTGSLARQFDRISGVLASLGYLSDGTVTAAGRILRRIYAERDLTIAECVRTGVWDGLDPVSLAAAVTALVYEPRTEARGEGDEPHGIVRQTIAAQQRAWRRITRAEELHDVPPSPGVEAAASQAMGRWAAGETLARTLEGGELLSPGDFVRLANRVVDVLDHIRSVAPDSDLYHNAEQAIGRLRRGVVAFDQG
jgi:ATP-dependent RNA helicase HelY